MAAKPATRIVAADRIASMFSLRDADLYGLMTDKFLRRGRGLFLKTRGYSARKHCARIESLQKAQIEIGTDRYRNWMAAGNASR